MYKSTPVFNLTTNRVGGQRHAPAALAPGMTDPATHCIGGWVGSRTGLDGCGKPHPTEIRLPDRPARSQSIYRLCYTGREI
jgi:hypothetical protein